MPGREALSHTRQQDKQAMPWRSRRYIVTIMESLPHASPLSSSYACPAENSIALIRAKRLEKGNYTPDQGQLRNRAFRPASLSGDGSYPSGPERQQVQLPGDRIMTPSMTACPPTLFIF